MAKKWPFKDPTEVLDYTFDWSPRDIEGDPITVIETDVITGDVVVTASAITGDALTTHRLSGGTVDSVVNLHATLQSGQELDQDVAIQIKERT